MVLSPTRKLLWIVAVLVTALVVTVAVFEMRQAAYQPAVFGPSRIAQ
jgi:hypothetical protein